MAKHTTWTVEMDAYLRHHYYEKSASAIAKTFNITKSAVLRRAKELKIPSKANTKHAIFRRYGDDELAFIKANIETLGLKGVAAKLNRTPEGIRKCANRLGIMTGTVNHPLTDEERSILTAYITSKTYRELGSMLGRGEEETRWHARQLGLSKQTSKGRTS